MRLPDMKRSVLVVAWWSRGSGKKRKMHGSAFYPLQRPQLRTYTFYPWLWSCTNVVQIWSEVKFDFILVQP